MITYNILMEVIAWTAIIICVIHVAFNVGVYFGGVLNNTNYWSIKRESMIAKNDIWYLLPTIGVNFTPSLEIIFYWLNYQIYINYTINKNES